jgi:hypothetical protein
MNLIKRTLPWIAIGSGLIFTTGCELIASVDHDLIKNGTGGNAAGGATSASSSTTTDASSSSSTGTGGTGGGCAGPSECPTPVQECDMATCDAMVCGSTHKTPHTMCTMDAGHVCDGNGACVGCVDATDCTGTDICSAAHACVAATCNDGVKDGDETDKDCGGSCGATCPNTGVCGTFNDCLSGVCTNLVCVACAPDTDCQSGDYCNAGVCAKKDLDGTPCTVGNSCTSGNCVDVTGASPDKICCDQPCAGSCSSCLATETGAAMNGKCLFITTGTDPKAACATTGTDCNTGSCDGAGACGFKPTSAVCGNGPMCSSDTLDPQDTCDAAHVCQPGIAAPCAMSFSCADGTSCNAACSATGTAPTATSTGCKAGFFCDTVPATPACINTLKATAAPCNNNYECANGMCVASICN